MGAETLSLGEQFRLQQGYFEKMLGWVHGPPLRVNVRSVERTFERFPDTLSFAVVPHWSSCGKTYAQACQLGMSLIRDCCPGFVHRDEVGTGNPMEDPAGSFSWGRVIDGNQPRRDESSKFILLALKADPVFGIMMSHSWDSLSPNWRPTDMFTAMCLFAYQPAGTREKFYAHAPSSALAVCGSPEYNHPDPGVPALRPVFSVCLDTSKSHAKYLALSWCDPRVLEDHVVSRS